MTLVTGLEAAFDRNVLAGLDVRAQEPAQLPRYANSYDSGGNRTQLLLAEGSRLELVPAMKRGEQPDVVLIAPGYHEFTQAPLRFKGSLAGISLQGPLRTVSADNRVIHHGDPAGVAGRFVRPGWIVFFSEEDTGEAEALAVRVAEMRAVAVLTRGYNGATLFDSDGTRQHWDAFAANPVDPTGAGDCFASAFMFRLAETEELAKAMEFALAAGALATEGHGLSGIASREAIEARLAREAA